MLVSPRERTRPTVAHAPRRNGRVELARIHDRRFEFLPGNHALHQVRRTFRGEDERGRPVDVAVTFNHEWIRCLLADLAQACDAPQLDGACEHDAAH